MKAASGRGAAEGTTTHMNAIVLDRFGGVEELTPRSIPIPEVGDDDVLIRVEYAATGSWDAAEREGELAQAFGVPSTFPYVLGWDGVGTVSAVGRNVTRFAAGDRVYAAAKPVPRGGLYAEYGVVQETHVAHVPERLPTAQAGALPWDALTALSGVETLHLQPGQTVMVFGASGGIGHMAVQLARHAGARVFAVASGADGVALALRLGAESAVDGRRDDVLAAAAAFAPDGVDAAVFTAGGETAERSLRALKKAGRIAWTNGVDPVPEAPQGMTLTFFSGTPSPATTDRLNAIIEESSFEVNIAQTFPLERARDAHLALREHYVGKMLLRVAPHPDEHEGDNA